MALYVGQFLLTGAFLNRTAAPYLQKRYRFLRDLSFEAAGSTITARAAGKYFLVGFNGSLTAKLQQFHFQPSRRRVVMALSLELQPRFLKPLLTALIERNLRGRAGITWSESRLTLDLDRATFFTALRESTGGDNILGLIRISPDERWRSDGIAFNIYLGPADSGALGDDKGNGMEGE